VSRKYNLPACHENQHCDRKRRQQLDCGLAALATNVLPAHRFAFDSNHANDAARLRVTDQDRKATTLDRASK
jgi:hypothetical protein